jgi:hypothetical protein
MGWTLPTPAGATVKRLAAGARRASWRMAGSLYWWIRHRLPARLRALQQPILAVDHELVR